MASKLDINIRAATSTYRMLVRNPIAGVTAYKSITYNSPTNELILTMNDGYVAFMPANFTGPPVINPNGQFPSSDANTTGQFTLRDWSGFNDLIYFTGVSSGLTSFNNSGGGAIPCGPNFGVNSQVYFTLLGNGNHWTCNNTQLRFTNDFWNTSNNAFSFPGVADFGSFQAHDGSFAIVVISNNAHFINAGSNPGLLTNWESIAIPAPNFTGSCKISANDNGTIIVLGASSGNLKLWNRIAGTIINIPLADSWLQTGLASADICQAVYSPQFDGFIMIAESEEIVFMPSNGTELNGLTAPATPLFVNFDTGIRVLCQSSLPDGSIIMGLHTDTASLWGFAVTRFMPVA